MFYLEGKAQNWAWQKLSTYLNTHSVFTITIVLKHSQHIFLSKAISRWKRNRNGKICKPLRKKKKWKCRDYCCPGQERMWSSNAIVHACIFWNVKEQQIILDHKMMRKRYLPILGTSKNQFFRHSSMKLLYCITLTRSTLFWKLICNLLY